MPTRRDLHLALGAFCIGFAAGIAIFTAAACSRGVIL